MRKNHPLRALVGLLLLGLATSVLVAWGFAVFVDWTKSSKAFIGGEPVLVTDRGVQHYWGLDAGFGWAALNYRGYLADQMIGMDGVRRIYPPDLPGIMPILNNEILLDCTWDSARTVTERRMSEQEVPGNYYPSLEIRLSGWPRYCMYRPVVFMDADPSLHLTNLETYVHARDRVVPTHLFPQGLALNTAFYALLWGLVLVAAPATRRWNRTRRGLCARCGYDPAGLTTCPECGSGLTSA